VIVPAAGGAYSAMSSGLFTYSKTDLAVGGVLPIWITRTYRSQDRNAAGTWNQRAFGLGTTLNYDLFLYSNSEVASGTYNDAELVMPDGSEIVCQNPVSGQTDYTQATFLCDSQPTGIWFHSSIAWNAGTSQWHLTRKDGTVYALAKGALLQSINDRYGNSITVSRGHPTTITSSSGRFVTLNYNTNALIASAIDNTNREVDYTYDAYKRLASVTYTTYSQFATTTYGYFGGPNDLGDLGLIVVNVNHTTNTSDQFDINYDSNHRVSRVANNPFFSPTLTYTYTVSNGHVTQCTVNMPSGSSQPGALSKRILGFDSAGYLVSDTRGVLSGNAGETTTFTRNANVVINGGNVNPELITSITDSLTPAGADDDFPLRRDDRQQPHHVCGPDEHHRGIRSIAGRHDDNHVRHFDRSDLRRNQLNYRPVAASDDLWDRPGDGERHFGDRSVAAAAN
jgi:YD repeat-containing protein